MIDKRRYFSRYFFCFLAAAILAALATISPSGPKGVPHPHATNRAPAQAVASQHPPATSPKMASPQMARVQRKPTAPPAATRATQSPVAIGKQTPAEVKCTGDALRPTPPQNSGGVPNLTSLGIPAPSTKEGDLATLKVACRREEPNDLRDRLKEEAAKARTMLSQRSSDDSPSVRAGIGTYQGRPLSEKEFAVNVRGTFR